MRKTLILIALLVFSAQAPAKLKVFACEPEWASLTKELAGDLATVFSATTAQQDPHRIQARPALIAQLRQADLAICTGAELEAGWLPMLQRRASNSRVLPGNTGYLEAADFVDLLEKPARLDRADGDVHASGNPHLHLDPRNVSKVAQALSARLVTLDPANATQYQERLTDFQQRWQTALQRWQDRAAPLRGMAIVVAHTDWVYLEHWLGLKRIAALEPKPGVPPSSRHLADVLAQTETHDVQAVLHAAYQDKRAADWLTARSGAKALQLPYTVGGSKKARDLFGLFDETIDLLLEARP